MNKTSTTFEETDYELYKLIRKIESILFKEIRVACAAGADIDAYHSEEGANPYHSQTSSGIFLEYYYGAPSRIWTPWGKWRFLVNLSYRLSDLKPVVNRFLEHLGITEFMPLKQSSMGEIGPVYAILSIDNQELPEPKMKEEQEYLPYELCRDIWKKMTQQYNDEQAGLL